MFRAFCFSFRSCVRACRRHVEPQVTGTTLVPCSNYIISHPSHPRHAFAKSDSRLTRSCGNYNTQLRGTVTQYSTLLVLYSTAQSMGCMSCGHVAAASRTAASRVYFSVQVSIRVVFSFSLFFFFSRLFFLSYFALGMISFLFFKKGGGE